MKKTIKIGLVCGLFFAGLTNSNAQVFEGPSNTPPSPTGSVFGDYCSSTSNYSFAAGYKSNATGLYSIALGVRNLSSNSHATTIGIDLEATANRSMVIGSGSASPSGGIGGGPITKLVNNISGSLMVGFNSDIPTLFVGEAQGVGTFGKIGIGTSTPTTTLDVNGTIKSSKGWGDWFQMHTTNGNGFWRVHNPQSQKYLAFGWDDGSATNQSYSLRMHQSGDVSIGTSDSEGYKLHVANTNNNKGTAIRADAINGHIRLFETDGSGPTTNFTQIERNADAFHIYQNNGATYQHVLTADMDGNVGIGTTTPAAGYKLSVKGKMIAEEITVQLYADWPDFVFEKEYELMDLDNVKSYIDENAHLPNVPSAKEVEESGINLGEMDAILLQKIEELTLYMIDIQEDNKVLKARVKDLESINTH